MKDEFDPDAPGPPREVHEDAAARERSMTDPEETASQIVMPLIKLLGERNRGRRSMAVMREDTTTLNRAANAIADALREAHAAGKAEGAAEEFRRGYLIACCNIANLHNDPDTAADVLMEGNLTEADITDLSEYDAKALREIRKARPDDPIRQRDEEGTQDG